VEERDLSRREMVAYRF
jgi:hypothetical protein